MVLNKEAFVVFFGVACCLGNAAKASMLVWSGRTEEGFAPKGWRLRTGRFHSGSQTIDCMRFRSLHWITAFQRTAFLFTGNTMAELERMIEVVVERLKQAINGVFLFAKQLKLRSQLLWWNSIMYFLFSSLPLAKPF